jgi:hypothetical protein
LTEEHNEKFYNDNKVSPFVSLPVESVAQLKSVKEGTVSAANIITPQGIPLIVSSGSIENNILSLSFSFHSNSNFTFPVSLHIIFFFSKVKILHQVNNIEIPSHDDLYSFSIILSYEIEKTLIENPHPKVFLALCGTPVNKNKIYWSSTSFLQR